MTPIISHVLGMPTNKNKGKRGPNPIRHLSIHKLFISFWNKGYEIFWGEQVPLKEDQYNKSSKTKQINQQNLHIHKFSLKFQSAATAHIPTPHVQTWLDACSTGHLPSVEGYQSLAAWKYPLENEGMSTWKGNIVFQPAIFDGKKLVVLGKFLFEVRFLDTYVIINL